MKIKDWLWLGGLAVLAAVIWLRDRSWFSAAEEVLPILGALPLFAYLAAPWRWRETAFSLHRPSLAVAGVCLVVGLAANLTLLLALAWTAGLWAWLRNRLAADRLGQTRRLLVLPLMAFPWVTLDGAALGWWFRLSAAWVTAGMFRSLGFSVARAGTQLLVQGLPVSVDASCSGLKVLQAMLIAGTVIAFLQLGRHRSYWWSLPCLVLMAWLANTLRVLTLSATALSFGVEFAAGWFHAWGGWLVLVLMFALCWGGLALWRRATETTAPGAVPFMKAFSPSNRIEWAILAFCAWRSADLVQAWLHAPYDRLGWLAFALWCVPAALAHWPGSQAPGGAAPLAWLPWLAVTLGLLGSLGDLNALAYCGLASAVGALACHRAPTASPVRSNEGPGLRAWPSLLWLLLAVCWMPLLGWAWSRCSPLGVVRLRLALATLAAVVGGWAVTRRH